MMHNGEIYQARQIVHILLKLKDLISFTKISYLMNDQICPYTSKFFHLSILIYIIVICDLPNFNCSANICLASI